MHQRRTRAIAAGALLLAAPLFSSCGFDYATDRVNTISAGVNDRSTDVNVLGSVIISGEPDVGSFIATLSITQGDVADSLVSVTAGSDNALEAEGFEPLAIPSGGFVSLIQEGGVPVTGDIALGAFVPVTLTFESGTAVDVTVPVVRPCFQYADKVELPGDALDETADSELEVEIAESEAAEEGDGTLDPYSCETPESQAH